MPTDPSDPDITRMVRLAEDYLADAEILAQTTCMRSHGAYLLQLTAFEILLKALRRLHDDTLSRSHDYRGLFEGLPVQVRGELIRLAQARLGPEADYADPGVLLDHLSANFVALRYSYEKSQGESLEATRARGEQWLAQGAPLDRADFVLHPEELFGLTEALREFLPTTSA